MKSNSDLLIVNIIIRLLIRTKLYYLLQKGKKRITRKPTCRTLHNLNTENSEPYLR